MNQKFCVKQIISQKLKIVMFLLKNNEFGASIPDLQEILEGVL